MKKRVIVLLLSAVLALGALAGCAKTETKDQPAPAKTEQTENKPEKSAEADKKANDQEQVTLLVYSGAGLKRAMEPSREAFEKLHPNVTLDMNYNGSGKLLAQLQASQKGDLFIVGARHDYDTAVEQGLAEDGRGLFEHTPAIVVQKGNPKNIQSLEDLAKEGVTVVLADPSAASIGKTAQKILEKNNLQKINDNVVNQTSTVNEIISAVQSKNADAGICTKDSAFNAEGVELIAIPKDQNVSQVIFGSVCTTTENKEAATEFLDFLQNGEGKAIFEKNGFTPAGQ